MANEYATLTELKNARKITADDRDEDLQRALTAASRQIDRRTGRRFWLDADASARVYGVTGRTTRDGRLLVDDIGVLTDLVVETGSGTSWTAVADYDTGPDNALVRGEPITELTGVPVTGSRIRITARWGWPAVPDDVKMATLLLANRLYGRKDSPGGVIGSADWGAVRVSRLDPDVEALIGPFILPGIA